MLVISRFGFEGWIWVLIASVPDLCILFTSKVSSQILAKFGTHPSFYACPHYLQVSKGSDHKQPRKSDVIYPLL